MEELTVEQIAKHYSAMMDSVRLLETGKKTEHTVEEWATISSCNVDHVELMLTKTYWTTEDMTRAIAVVV